MSPRDTARAIAVGRLAFGAGLIVAPRLSTSLFLGRHGRSPASSFYARATGVRDIVLGALVLHTVDRPGIGPRSVATVAAVDAVDGLAALTILDEGERPRVALLALIALGSAVSGAMASRGLGEPAAAG